jgi:hypothetical protein
MLNYEQTVINGVPTKGHNIFVIALSDTNDLIYRDLFNSLGSGYTFNINKYRIPGFVWDMYTLAKKIPTTTRTVELDNLYVTRHTLEYDEAIFKRIWVNNFDDNPGSDLFSPLSSYYPLALDNKLSFENQQYKIDNFSFSPLVSDDGKSEHEPGENTIYKASVIPLFPLFFTSTNSAHLSYGPVFMESFNISINGMTSLSDVEIKCSFKGGKTLISPETISIIKPDIEENEKEITFDGFNTYEIQDYKNYRTANLSDCLVSFFQPGSLEHSELKSELFKNLKITQSKDTKKTNYVFTSKSNTNKIINMTLRIDQNIGLTHTNPVLDNGTYTDVIGPKFASLESRVVKGSVTIFNANLDDYLDKYPTSSITMYFGGNFLFYFKDVDWSNPIMSMSPSGSRIHTWNFTARLPQNAGFWGGNKTAVSEINIDYKSVLALS